MSTIIATASKCEVYVSVETTTSNRRKAHLSLSNDHGTEVSLHIPLFTSYLYQRRMEFSLRFFPKVFFFPIVFEILIFVKSESQDTGFLNTSCSLLSENHSELSLRWQIVPKPYRQWSLGQGNVALKNICLPPNVRKYGVARLRKHGNVFMQTNQDKLTKSALWVGSTQPVCSTAEELSRL